MFLCPLACIVFSVGEASTEFWCDTGAELVKGECGFDPAPERGLLGSSVDELFVMNGWFSLPQWEPDSKQSSIV